MQNELAMHDITNLLTVPVINIPLNRLHVIELRHPVNCYFGMLFFYWLPHSHTSFKVTVSTTLLVSFVTEHQYLSFSQLNTLNVIEYLLLVLTKNINDGKILNSRKSWILEKIKNVLDLKDIILRVFSFSALNYDQSLSSIFIFYFQWRKKWSV